MLDSEATPQMSGTTIPLILPAPLYYFLLIRLGEELRVVAMQAIAQIYLRTSVTSNQHGNQEGVVNFR